MTQTTPAPALLRLDSIRKSFGGVLALANVSFELARGEVHALVGENGAGKTTLIKIITGAHAPDAGTLEIDGQTVDRNDPTRAKQLGIAAIYQQPALFAELTVAENIALRIEQRGAWRTIRWRERHARAIELLGRVGAGVSPLARASDLSMPEQQLVEIASAVGAGARILILDEPTASLSGREVENLFRIIGELRQAGVGMIYISHRLDELPRIADRVTVLRDGHYIGTHPMASVDRDELIRLMVGRSLEAVFPKTPAAIGPAVLEARGLNCRQLRIRDVSLTVRSGEILGLAGLVGAGRTELARVLFGLHAADSGDILWRGRPVDIRDPAAAAELGIAYIPEDRRRHGVILEMPVAANTTLATLRSMTHGGLIDFAEERRVARTIVVRLAIKTPSIHTPVANLSGGNQQKVALARWLVAEPQLLILDEPTQGVDVGAKAEIHRLMSELAGRGIAILMISSELPEVLGMSDRIAVMHAGTIVGTLARSEATQEKVLALALGVGQSAGAAA
jgi:rhamnose transport system ATP-binding protein